MKTPKISIIVAFSDENQSIGSNNQLMWKISGDMKRFKELTTGHTVIMGRKTFESIGKTLPNRTNIIITRQNILIPGALIANSLEQALKQAFLTEKEEIFIIGGGEIYKQSIQQADKIYATIVKTLDKGDVFFPDYREMFTRETFREEHLEHDPPYIYVNLEK